MWVTSRTGSVGWGFGDLRKAVWWVRASERENQDSNLGETRRICALRAPRVGWVESWRCKSSQHRKIVSLPPQVEKPLNSKRWIKVSYLNQFREFRVFGFLYMLMNILWTLCLFHVFVSWSYIFGPWILQNVMLNTPPNQLYVGPN